MRNSIINRFINYIVDLKLIKIPAEIEIKKVKFN